MIDLHCHILPGLDDGASDFSESLEMAKIAAADGITKIVATPHVNDKFRSAKKNEQIRYRIYEQSSVLNYRFTELNIPVEILQGAEVSAFLDPASCKAYTINDTPYILIEFPQTHVPLDAKEIIFRMLIDGFRPIIAHPERNPSIIKNPGLLFELLDSNVFVQITADSLTGGFGPDEEVCSKYLLEKGVVSFIATDAHSPNGRRPVLSKGLKIAENIIGKENALKLVTTNPEAMLAGEPIPQSLNPSIP